ncbi:MAG: Crp/Fnr family transcriptional regulator [Marinifilaceae bacterium]|jgi:CRP-like cAMP-binding protein|nr:Crp/Fnr family transcriptional regulator [Marinifilaceae bacterium]
MELIELFKNKKDLIYKKGELIVEQNSICRYLFFIFEGSTRTYNIDKNGVDSTHWFAFKNQPITLFHSFYNQTPSFYGLEAMEDCVLRCVTKAEMDTHITQSSENFNLYNKLVEQAVKRLTDRNLCLQNLTAKERYLKLLEEEPLVFQKANLGHIASYLGITQQSLSRIRAEK